MKAALHFCIMVATLTVLAHAAGNNFVTCYTDEDCQKIATSTQVSHPGPVQGPCNSLKTTNKHLEMAADGQCTMSIVQISTKGCNKIVRGNSVLPVKCVRYTQ